MKKPSKKYANKGGSDPIIGKLLNLKSTYYCHIYDDYCHIKGKR